MANLNHQNGNAPLAGEANQETENHHSILKGALKIGKLQASCRTFGELAPAISKMGYEPVPIVPGTKRPRPSNWQKDGGFARQAANFYTDYTGILTKHCPGVDIDVSDKALVLLIEEIVYKVVGGKDAPAPARTGMYPRTLLLFKTDEPFSKLTTASYSLPTDPIIDGKLKASKVEILASGQQFVAFAIHRDTKEPYTWANSGDPTTVPRSALPVITFEMAAEIIQRCDLLLEEHGTKTGKPKISDVPRIAQVSTLELIAKESDLCKSALAAIPNDHVDFDEWITLLYAVKGALGKAGLAPFLDWSRKCELKHDEANTQSEWGKAKPNRIGAGSVYYLAREHGWQDPRRIATVDDFDVINAHADDLPRLPAFKRNDKGEIETSKENVVLALRRPDICGFQLRHDLFRGEVMLARPESEGWRAMKDTDYTGICLALERGIGGFKDIRKERIRDAVAYVAEEHEFDSAQHWLKALKWDGKERVAVTLPHYFGTEDSPYTRAIGLYFWTALAGRVMQPGIKADMVPVAVGAQGIGKSSTIKAIAPAPEHFLELDLGGKEDDMARMMLGKLVVELGELKGLNKREIEHVKSFITRTHEEWVPKFKEMKTSYPRRSMFFGSTNKSEFLQDDTGNRRWLPFDVGLCAADAMKADREQLWAEGLEIFNSGGVLWQGAERLASSEHDNFVVRDAWEETVERWLQESDCGGLVNSKTKFSAVDVLTAAVGIEPKFITQSHKDRMARLLKELGYTRTRERKAGKAQRRVYFQADEV